MMPSDAIEPPVGVRDGERSDRDGGSEPPSLEGQGALPVSPTTSTSNDELTVSLTHARPDPALGEFESGSTAAENRVGGDGPVKQAVFPLDVGIPLASVSLDPSSRHESPHADTLNALAGLKLDSTDASAAAPPSDASVTSSEALAALDLVNHSSPASHQERRRVEPAEGESSDDPDDGPAARRSSWTTILLASYASAVTFGLIWVLMSGRRMRESAETDFLPPADTRPDPGRRADQSRRIVAPPPIAAEHLTTLGKAVSLGQIEATPLAVSTGPVTLLRNNIAGTEKKSGGTKALKLRLRLRNISTETVLSPLDEAFVRERARADPDTYIETAPGGPTISMFALAVESEWSIVGQLFSELKPGETFETLVVTVPNALSQKTDEMTWRIRLRTDINHTDDLGVRFRADQIKPGP
jgi:hypothetical protein